MASDIILKDNTEAAQYTVEIVGSLTKVRHPNGESNFKIDSNPRMCHVAIGGGEETTNASLSISDKRGRTTIGSKYLSTETVRAQEISTERLGVSELNIATKMAEQLKSGKINVVGKDGDPVVTIDGEKGDILLKEIGGSLVNKLRELEQSTGSAGSSVSSKISQPLQFTNSEKPLIYILESGTNNPERSILSHSTSYDNWGLSYRDKGDKMIFQAGGSPVLTVDLGKKKVGVGTDNPSHALHVDGEVAGRGGFKSLSDVRCKRNVKGLSDSIEKIMNLRGVSFNWNEDELTGVNPPKNLEFGFIAQEVEKVLPDLVSKDDLGRQSLSYSSLVPLLVESIQQQQRMIDEQKKVINQHEERNKSLEKKLGQIEKLLTSIADENTTS